MESEYTKSDLIKFFNLSFLNKEILSPQVWGGCFFRKCKNIENFIDNVFDLFRNRFDLIDDDESKYLEKPAPDFIAHRHGQSIINSYKANECKTNFCLRMRVGLRRTWKENL